MPENVAEAVLKQKDLPLFVSISLKELGEPGSRGRRLREIENIIGVNADTLDASNQKIVIEFRNPEE